MCKKFNLLVAATLVAASSTSAAVLITSDFSDSSVTSGTTIGGINWTGDSHFSGGSSTTLTTPGAGVITGTVFTNSDTNDRIGANINVQTVSGAGYSTGAPVWSSDYTIGYSLTNASDTFSLTDVSLTGFALNSSAGFQISPRVIEFSVSILNSTGTTTFASGVLSQTIPASSTNGLGFTIALAGTTLLDGATLGGQTGNFILRVSADKPTETSGAFAAYDNLSLNGSYAAVPEPSTYGLLGAGALASVVLARRRRKVA